MPHWDVTLASPDSGVLTPGWLPLGRPRKPLPHQRVCPREGGGLRATEERLLPPAGCPHLPHGLPAEL